MSNQMIYNWIVKVIQSCQSLTQLENARRLITIYMQRAESHDIYYHKLTIIHQTHLIKML